MAEHDLTGKDLEHGADLSAPHHLEPAAVERGAGPHLVEVAVGYERDGRSIRESAQIGRCLQIRDDLILSCEAREQRLAGLDRLRGGKLRGIEVALDLQYLVAQRDIAVREQCV